MTGFYPRLRDARKDDDDLQICIENVVNKLEDTQTSEDRPGMLLGKIQSGKTRGFLGVIAKAFDRDFNIALVFTKGTKTLATQTVRRISRDFDEFIENEEVQVFDIMHMPERLIAVFDRLGRINDLESALREAFEEGGHEAGVVFLQNDAARGIIPCAPNKVAMSNVVTVRPAGFYLPTDFDTVGTKATAKALLTLDEALLGKSKLADRLISISLDQAIEYLRLTKSAIKLPKDDSFYWDAMEGLLRYYSQMSDSKEVQLLVETGRKLGKLQSGGKSGQSIIGGTTIRGLLNASGRSEPALVMLRQDGEQRRLGWAGKQDFWWPVLTAPTTGAPCVFSNP